MVDSVRFDVSTCVAERRKSLAGIGLANLEYVIDRPSWRRRRYVFDRRRQTDADEDLGVMS